MFREIVLANNCWLQGQGVRRMRHFEPHGSSAESTAHDCRDLHSEVEDIKKEHSRLRGRTSFEASLVLLLSCLAACALLLMVGKEVAESMAASADAIERATQPGSRSSAEGVAQASPRANFVQLGAALRSP